MEAYNNIISFFYNGFASFYWNMVFWGAWIPIVLIFGFIETRVKFPKLLDIIGSGVIGFWLFVIIIRLSVIIITYVSAQIQNEFANLKDGYLWTFFVEKILPTYNILDGYLAPTTDFLLLFFPLIALLLFKADKIKPAFISNLLGLWTFVSMAFLIALSIGVIFSNPFAIFSFAAVIIIIQLYVFSSSAQIKKRYSKALFFLDMELAKSTTNEEERLSEFLRGLAILAAIAAFWFYLALSVEILTAFYTAIITGMLAILGFAVLVFSFTYEKLPNPHMRRQIGADTHASQKAAGITLITSLFGLLLIDGSLILNLREMGILETLRATLLLSTFIAFVFAVDSILILFKHIVDILIDFDPRNTALNVVFEEANIRPHLSATSNDAQGHAELRAYLEDAGASSLVTKYVTFSALMKQKNTVLIQGERIAEYNSSGFEAYREFVEQGDILVVLTNKQDLPKKRELLKHLGIIIHPREETYWGAAKLKIYDEHRVVLNEIHSAHISLQMTVEKSDVVLVQSASLDPSYLHVSEPLIYARPIGKGLVIVVGSLYFWTNQNLRKHRTFRLLDSVIDVIKAHFENNNKTVF